MSQIETTEIEDMGTWNAVTKKDNENLNVIDVYAKWCGPCKCKFSKPWLGYTSHSVLPTAGGHEPLQPLSLSLQPHAAGLENTYKQLLAKHYDVITEAAEAEKKREVKFWTICAETMGGPDAVADLTQFENDPCSHIMFYMRGQCKETIAVRSIRLGRNPAPALVPLIFMLHATGAERAEDQKDHGRSARRVPPAGIVVDCLASTRLCQSHLCTLHTHLCYPPTR